MQDVSLDGTDYKTCVYVDMVCMVHSNLLANSAVGLIRKAFTLCLASFNALWLFRVAFLFHAAW
jgi:hypothetical protein